ncbi:FUSC family protein [Scleromatobacter humisilvae]|uniref:FUSC family protein n=1 Tax=Scleromatobacter humisilvae TaxID=2897159 RepID=A0A9X1YNB5_9BURK|nr:FUSC family protein [Scleromatobacter humisilvae]MCK9688620.1 FUSC family protein [Scleromatobacter humisilvae]
MSEVLIRSLREAALTLLAMLGTLAGVHWIEPGAAPAILGAVLSLSLARSHLAGERRGALEALLALPLVALASVGVGALLRHAPWAGASVFVAGMALSIWMRRYGARALRVGSLIALPLVTILVVPHLPRNESGRLPPLLVPVAVALVALAWVMLAQALGRRLGWLAPQDPVDAGPARAEGPGAMRASPHTRMALQMAVALAASFAAGYLVFPSHWSWVVLTAFIVNSGNRGRQDVVYKSALRVLGAAGGTVVAMLFTGAVVDGPGAAALILASVFLGVWLRPAGYGWWALFVTLALALLQSLQPAAAPPLLWQRLFEILVGAAIGLAAAWWVYPIRSTDVLRKRIAEALAAMSDALDPQVAERRADGVIAAMKRVEQLRPSFRARHLALRRWQPLQPVEWIDALLACRSGVVTLVERRETPGAVRKAIGAARKAMREPAEIGAALAALRQLLERPPAVA